MFISKLHRAVAFELKAVLGLFSIEVHASACSSDIAVLVKAGLAVFFAVAP